MGMLRSLGSDENLTTEPHDESRCLSNALTGDLTRLPFSSLYHCRGGHLAIATRVSNSKYVLSQLNAGNDHVCIVES